MVMTSKRIGAATMILSALLFTGCFFSSTAEVISIPGEGVLAVSINFSGNWLSCLPTSTPGDTATFDCAYFTPENISTFSLSSVELLVRAFIIDPLVIQVPTTVSNVRGTFAHAAGSGNLVVQGPLASVPIDITRNLTAEAGTSLYIVSVPEAFETANPTGNYAFTLGLNAPLGTTSIPVKAVLTASVRTLAGQNYYPPVFPCVTNMAAAPGGTINTSLPTSTLTLPAASTIPVCAGERYNFGPGAVPALPPWALVALALLLAGLGVARSRRLAR